MLHRNKLTVMTERGILLNGLLFEDGESDTVLINITGLHGNFFTNPFYRTFGDKLAKNGFHFLYAETCDAFPRLETYNAISKAFEFAGSYNERFSYIIDDIKSYVDKAFEMGYKHIYLSGHSLGANKVIHYLSKTKDERAERFLLLSPGDISQLTSPVTKSEKDEIKNLYYGGKGESKLPFQLFGWLSCTVNTAFDWTSDCILDNVSQSGEPPFDDLLHIRHKGAILAGSLDTYSAGDTTGFLSKINQSLKTKDENQIFVIDETGHTYQNKEEETAQKILSIVLTWKEESRS